MALTIDMLENKEFKVVPKDGYDPNEVDMFLDEIIDEIEQLQKENQRLRTESTRRPVGTAPSSVQGSAPSEETVRSMLMNAQRVCDDTMNDAKKRADETLRTARDEADELLRAARADESALNAENEALRSAVTDYRANYQRMLEEQMRWLKDGTLLG